MKTFTSSISDSEIKNLKITLIRCTNYNTDGYPIRSLVGVIPSNTLTHMAALVAEIPITDFLKGASVNILTVDESVHRIPFKKIIRDSLKPQTKSIVLLVGVQTNQWPRAIDVADYFLLQKIPVLIGGFHVSGMLSMIGETPELTQAMQKGITLVAGEVENGKLTEIIKDIVYNKNKNLYNFLNELPDLSEIPMPFLRKENLKGFARQMATIDTGRGCPFSCRFCTIINVQGKKVRPRKPHHVIEFIRKSYIESNITSFFFTDDNFSRNPYWRELFLMLINLKEIEKIPFSFMMQVDLAAKKIPPGDFFTLAAKAGCSQCFFGVESVNKENLRSQGKFQNNTSEYKDLVDHCHSMGIACQAGYILGLPFDTPKSIRTDVAELQRIGFDSVSFFILTPLPGSEDHQTWLKQGRKMDPDYNKYDVTYVTIDHEIMTKEELTKAYKDAWNQFYSTEHLMKLSQVWKKDRKKLWDRILFWFWYMYAWRAENMHPMSGGFWTMRNRNDRRSTFQKETLVNFWFNELKRNVKRIKEVTKLVFTFINIILKTREIK